MSHGLVHQKLDENTPPRDVIPVVIVRCHATKFMHFVIFADFGKWLLADLPLFSKGGKWTGNQMPGPSLFPLANRCHASGAWTGGGHEDCVYPHFQ